MDPQQRILRVIESFPQEVIWRTCTRCILSVHYSAKYYVNSICTLYAIQILYLKTRRGLEPMTKDIQLNVDIMSPLLEQKTSSEVSLSYTYRQRQGRRYVTS